jgi:putative RecB family exonuclease
MAERDPEYDWARLQEVKGQPRSVSQVKSYLESLGGCRYAYFLKRIVQAWDRPAAWLPMGLAVHEAAEFWEKSGRKATLAEVEAKFAESYREHTERLEKDTANTDVWFPSGPYFGQVDIDRRFKIGLEQTRAYVDYYVNQQPGEVVWITPSGEPAIEFGFRFQLDGVEIIGYIDQVVQVRPPRPRTASGAVSKAKATVAGWNELPDLLRLRDIKTGKSPGDTMQLKVYSEAVLDNLGVEITHGDYWMGKQGGPTQAYDLREMSRDQLSELFVTMNEGVRAENFDPSPSEDKCRFCGVSAACIYREG